MPRRLLSALVLAALVAAPRAATASTDYPAAIAEDLGLAKAPSCTLCHASEAGGAGTVVTAFGGAMQAFGLVGKNRGTLLAALATARARRNDADDDGVPDVDELVAGTDPNDGAGASAVRAPAYGCAASPSASIAPNALAALVALVVVTCFAARTGRSARGAGRPSRDGRGRGTRRARR